VGGLIDWGDERIVQNVGERAIDVGNWYAQLFRNVMAWTGRLAEFSPAPGGADSP
jgi:hypothetical protein